MADPELTLGLRRWKLSAQRLAARVMVGAGSERLIAHSFTTPDGGDAEQVGVEAGPGVMGQLDD